MIDLAEMLALCLTILGVALIGRGAHDARLRAEALRMRSDQVNDHLARLEAVEAKVAKLDAAVTDAHTALALKRR